MSRAGLLVQRDCEGSYKNLEIKNYGTKVDHYGNDNGRNSDFFKAKKTAKRQNVNKSRKIITK